MAAPSDPRDLLQRLLEALKELRVPVMAERLEHEVDAGPDEGDSRLDFLWRLVEPQLRLRRERAVERRIAQARFPAYKTLDDFDFGFQNGLDRDRVFGLATLEFVRKGHNLLVAGMSGVGKSHICIALGHLACVAGFRTRYTTSAQMLTSLHASLATHELEPALKPYVLPQLLIIDEVGLDRPERDTARDAQLFYRVVSSRYDDQRSTVITSNIPWDGWGEALGDDLATVAILDRLIHHGHLLNIDGPSYRAAQHTELNRRPEADADDEGEQ